MNTIAQEYLNRNEQDHREAFNAYIKDCLAASKPLELNMIDFIQDQPRKQHIAIQKPKTNPLHQIIKREIHKNMEVHPDVSNGVLRLSMLQSFVMSQMAKASNKDESNAFYEAYRFVIESTPI